MVFLSHKVKVPELAPTDGGQTKTASALLMSISYRRYKYDREESAIRKTFSIALSWLFFLHCFVGLNSYTPQQKPQEPPLRHEVSVTLKLVQVFVTDKQGRPMTDLEKTDFEIFDNGQLETITEFERHILAAAGRMPEPREPVEPQKAAMPSSPSLKRLNRKFFFIFDVEKNDMQGLALSKKAAFRFMNTQVQPTDEVGVLSYQARRGLVVHEYLSTDHKRVRRAIEKLRGVPGTGSGGLPTEPDEGGDALGHLSLEPKGEEDDLAMLRRNFVSVLSEFAKALRHVPGYKNIVLFSCGFARLTLTEDSGLRHAYETMSKEFGASSSPVYTVNTLGARSSLLLAKDRGDLALRSLSALSGGRYFEDVAKADKIVTGLQNATGNYYVLGYYINEQWDGRFHEVKVRVKREGCVVSAQSGYYNPKPFVQFSDFEKDLHLMDLAFYENPQFQSPTELPLTALPCHDDSGAHLIIMAELPWENLREIVQPPVEVVSIVIDQNNNAVETKGGYVQIPDMAKKRIVYYSIISLNPGAYNCVMIVRNMKTGQSARARGAAIVPEPPASGLQLGPLLLLVPTADKDTAYFKLAKQNKETEGAAARTLEEFFPFLSNRLVPVMDEIPGGTFPVMGIIRAMAFNLPEVVVELSASLKADSGGKEIPISPSILKSERRGRVDILLLEFPLPQLEPGDYTLTLVATDEKSGVRTEVSRKIRLT